MFWNNQQVSVFLLLFQFWSGKLTVKLFALEHYYDSCTYIINVVKIFSAFFLPPDCSVKLPNVSLSGKRFNIKPIVLGVFILNVFAVRHIVMNFLSQTLLLLTFLCKISVVSLSTVKLFLLNSLLLYILPLKFKVLPLNFFNRIIHCWNL